MLAITLVQQPWWCPMCSYRGAWPMFGMGLIWLVVIVAIVWFVARFAGARGSRAEGGRAAEDILRERYARGEIDEATYRHMLDELRRS